MKYISANYGEMGRNDFPHIPGSARTGFWSQAMFTQIHQFEVVVSRQHLSGLVSFLKDNFYIHTNIPNKRTPLKVLLRGIHRPLEPAAVLHFHRVAFHCFQSIVLLFTVQTQCASKSILIIMMIMIISGRSS